MGKILLEIYDEAKKIGALNAQIKLAVLTKAPANKAKDMPDSPENVQTFKIALDEIKKEFK